jgi:hypothetical protein
MNYINPLFKKEIYHEEKRRFAHNINGFDLDIQP